MRAKSREYIGEIIGVLFLLLLTTAVAVGQAGQGGISGLVSDPSGAVVPGARVIVQDTANGATFSTVTSAAGLYSFIALPPGVYQVTISRTGFKTMTRSNLTVTVDQVAAVNLTLTVGSVQQVVKVTGSRSSIAGASYSTVGQLITQATIARVPLLSRDVYELVQLSAGVSATNGTPNAAATPGIQAQRTGLDVSAYSFNGAQQGTLYYMIDGSPIAVPESDLGAMLPAFRIPLDAVQEYRIETQDVPATYQSAGSGVISVVTKSGTNKFHGDAFVYMRPNAFSANDYFLKGSQISNGLPNRPSNFHRYQEGGSLGGPILHDKLFIFADYEGTQQASLENGTYTVPTSAERTGDFSADNFTIYNPLVPDQPNGTRQPFAGNSIPAGDLNPIALNYSKYLPLPNRAGVGPYHLNNYFNSGLDPDKAQKFDIRTDYMRSEKQHIFGRFSFSRQLTATADLYGASDIFDPNYFQNITNARNILLADDITLSHNTILQLRYSFIRHFENQTGDPRQKGFDITQLGFPASLANQQVYHDAPFISFGNYTTDLGSHPYTTFQYASMAHDALATLTTVIGKHELSFGYEFQKQLENIGQVIAPSGLYSFDNTATSSTTFAGNGSDYASFVLGMGSIPGGEGDNFTKDPFLAMADPYNAAYVQDNYHVAHNVTVNLGLRWDIFGGRTERYDRLEYFDPNLQFNVNGVALTGAEQFVGHGRSRSPYTKSMKDVSPRIGFSWQPTTQMVVRGGLGIYYGPSVKMDGNPYANSDGYYPVSIWQATAYNPDGNTVMVNSLSNPFPNGVVQPTGSSLGPATNLGNQLSTVLRSQRDPTTYDFNLGVEYQFPGDVVLSVAGVGSRGLFLPLEYEADLNQLPVSVIEGYNAALNNPVPNRWEAALPPGSQFYGQSTVPQWLALEKYPQFTCGGPNCGVAINGYTGGDSEYDSLQTKVEKRLTRYFTTLGAFTWAKLMTDDQQPPLDFVGYHANASAQDWRDLRFEHSVSAQDVKYAFNWQTSYDLPMGKGRAVNLNGWADRLAGGWTLNTILYLSTGVPINSPLGTGSKFLNQRANMNCDPSKGAPHTTAMWFNYTC